MPAQPGSLGVNLPVGNVTETEVVTAAPLGVDVTSAVVAEAITLDLTSGRSYQSCPWLVPGVLSEDADAPGNPASKSGLNHRDIGGEAGVSRDNVYYIVGHPQELIISRHSSTDPVDDDAVAGRRHGWGLSGDGVCAAAG